MTADGFRKLALSLPESSESSHMSHPDFRVGKRIFGTLSYPDPAWGMVKLTPPLQKRLIEKHPAVFVPASGGWGRQGSTNVKLRSATRESLWPALVAAWKGVAPAKLVKDFGGKQRCSR